MKLAVSSLSCALKIKVVSDRLFLLTRSFPKLRDFHFPKWKIVFVQNDSAHKDKVPFGQRNRDPKCQIAISRHHPGTIAQQFRQVFGPENHS